ncbi:carboxyl-terminal-processing peptidase 2, chloroplastic isoform X5 [Malania oleifera]|uniref:carboxyl-terminal-processing peptidase 2, chloroplastic isoform X5 n=1 Tax=Malania oleifera TaxID=397392 RepID=UPI0025ADF5BE|nr:carboxyl-terminal-processing peptidase 2, chloroplastic isoform X5 [Malania oleifera]
MEALAVAASASVYPSSSTSNGIRNTICSSKPSILQALRSNSLPIKIVEARLWSPLSCTWRNSSDRPRNFGLVSNLDRFPKNSSLFQPILGLNKSFSFLCGLLSPSCGFLLKLWKSTASPKNVICCSEKLKHTSVLFARLVVGAMLVMSVSVAVSKTTSWALSEENIIFLEAWRTIDRAYVDKTFNGQSWFQYRETALRNEPMNTREETYVAIRKMLATLDDPFTRFLEPKKFKSLRSGTQGALTGVGLSIGYPTGFDGPSAGLLVISATPGGPANRAGISSGDVISAIDDTSTETMGIYDAAERLQLEKGVIVYICDSRGVQDIYDTDGSNAIAASEPLAVLVNKGTASASEILAGALKDNKRAVLFGEPTFGKGKIQSVFELSDGSGLAVTVARYETPSHSDIDKVGVIPDHPLPMPFPKDEDGFCGCLQDPASACYLNRAGLFSQ